MKRNADGSVEGTPEEIAAYEAARVPVFVPASWSPVRHAANCPCEIAKRGWWSILPPTCTCGLAVMAPSAWTISWETP